MIRMGRSSRTEHTNETDNNQQQQPGYNYSNSSIPKETRAISESESMARDIKEGRLSGFVGSGTTLTGETSFQAMLRVDGHLTGRVSSENGTLIIGSTGQVDANIAVAAAVISGTVNGDIVATERLELGRTARVVGNVQTPRLMIEDGAIFEGSCTMLKAKEALEKRELEKSGGAAVSHYEEDEAEETNDYYSSSTYEETDEEDEPEEAAEAAAS